MEFPYNAIPDVPQAIFESHLNIIMSNNGQTIPFWRTAPEYQPEYYELEILKDNTKNDLPFEKSMDDIVNLNKYMCHICNIKVPKTYMKEHNGSLKHKTCNEIAKLALERTKLQLQLDVTTARKVEIIETYFCETCSTVVLNSDKDKHETSKIHKISLKHDKLLEDLLKIYSDIENVEIHSEVDELDLLQQRIDLEYLHEEPGLRADTKKDEIKKLDINEVLNVLKIELQSALDSRDKSVEGQVLQVREFMDNMKMKFDSLIDTSNALAERVKDYEKNNLDNKVHELKKRVDDLNNQSNVPVKRSWNSKTKALKKYQIQKKKECFHVKTQALVEIEENKETEAKIISPLKVQLSADSIKEVRNSENSPPLSDIGKKIDEIMAKYFGSNCTVDALNNNSDREHNKNKICRESNKIKSTKEKKLNHCNDDKNQDKNEGGKNDYIEKNIKNSENVENNQQDTNKIEHSVDNDEQNNNRNSEQNKNRESKNKKNKDHNKNTKAIEQKGINNSKNKIVPKSHINHTPGFNLVYYLKDISRKCETQPIHTVEALTDTIVQITAINGDKFKVLVNNFHSFHMKASDIYCKVCESPNVRRPEWHIIENEHRAKVMIPITDCHGIRQLDDIWNHCILCNDLIRNVEFHLQSLLHKNKLKHCLVELGKNDSDSEDDNVDKLEEIPTKKKLSVTAAITDLMLKNNLAMTSKNYLNCVLCDVIVNNNLTSVQQHINSFDHLSKFEQEQNENKLVDVDAERLYCIGCDVNINKSDIISHCNGKRHKKLLQEVLAKEGEILEDEVEETEIVLSSISQNIKVQSKGKIEDSELICFVCNITLYSIDEHMDSFEHKKSYYSYLEANKLNEIEADTFYCIPCNTVITIDYLMSHCTSRKHRLALKNGFDNGVTEEGLLPENNKELTQVSTISQTSLATGHVNNKIMPLKVLYQFRETSDSKKLFCTVCYEEVPYIRKLAEYHVSTLDHVVAFNLIMLWNKIKKRDDKYFCDICRLDMTYFSEITHVLGKQHASNLAKEPKGTVYEYDRTLVTHAYAMSHKVGDRTRLSPIISVSKK